MGLAFFVFGAGTVNIFMLFKANAALIASYGWQALMDGAARQFAELIITGYLSMAAYIVFKACEYRLVRDLAERAYNGTLRVLSADASATWAVRGKARSWVQWDNCNLTLRVS